MRIAICDDEKIMQAQLQEEIELYFKSLDVLTMCYDSGEALLADCENKQYDIVFLDIEMDGLNGLEVARRLHDWKEDLPVVMVTSHTELAMDGYEVQAFRFLAKPIDQKKLHATLKAIENCLCSEDRVIIVSDGVQRYLPCKSVCYIKCDNVYLDIVTTKERYLVRQKLKEFMKQLSANTFIQVHRSFVVNLQYVESFNGSHVYMQDGTEIPVRKANREGFKIAMIHHMNGRM